MIANKAVADLSVMLKDDKNICIPTAQWLLGMISAIDPDKMDVLRRRMLNNTVKNGLGLEKKTGHILAIDKHLIPFTGEDRHNDNFVISGKPKGGTSQFETYATMQVVTEEQLPTIAVVRVIEDSNDSGPPPIEVMLTRFDPDQIKCDKHFDNIF